MTFAGIFWVIFCIPETRRLPLEEIEALFGNAEDTMVFTSPGHESENGQEKPVVQHLEK